MTITVGVAIVLGNVSESVFPPYRVAIRSRCDGRIVHDILVYD